MNELNIPQAIEHLRNDGLLIYPTETFFALGCKVSSDQAISKIFQIKKRLFAMPLPVIVADINHIETVTQKDINLENDIETLANIFWPGALSLILKARITTSPLLTGGTGNIALRISAHPVAKALAHELGEAIVSSSANVSGQAPAVNLKDISSDITNQVNAFIDTPPVPAGNQPSTIIKPLGKKQIKMLRQGAISILQLQEAGFDIIT